MTLNSSIRYADGRLMVDHFPIPLETENSMSPFATPFYIYSFHRILANLRAVQAAFSHLSPSIHFSIKSNNVPAILRLLAQAGIGFDAVSDGEITYALKAGAHPSHIVLAGAGKTFEDLLHASAHGIGWINVENEAELFMLDRLAGHFNGPPRIALRYNPNITANTHASIATGHGTTKFGLSEETIHSIMKQRTRFGHISIEGLHVHIGSNLQDIHATVAAVEQTVAIADLYDDIHTINIGGGMPVAYRQGETVPQAVDFAHAITPVIKGYHLMLEPGRAIVADAGILVTSVLYVKKQAGERIVIVDTGMNHLMRPMLYQAHHEIIPLQQCESGFLLPSQVHGPICESTDVLGRDVMLPELERMDRLAILTTGAYGSVMSNHYNLRGPAREYGVMLDRHTVKTVRGGTYYLNEWEGDPEIPF